MQYTIHDEKLKCDRGVVGKMGRCLRHLSCLVLLFDSWDRWSLRLRDYLKYNSKLAMF